MWDLSRDNILFFIDLLFFIIIHIFSCGYDYCGYDSNNFVAVGKH